MAVTAHGVAGDSLSFSRLGLAAGAGGSVWVRPRFFFRGRCEPRARGVGPVGLRVGGLVLCSEIALQKRVLEIIFVCLGGYSSARASEARASFALSKSRRRVRRASGGRGHGRSSLRCKIFALIHKRCVAMRVKTLKQVLEIVHVHARLFVQSLSESSYHIRNVGARVILIHHMASWFVH